MYDQALALDLSASADRLALYHQPFVLADRALAFLFQQDHIAWSCPPVDHAQKPCPPSRSCTETRLSSPLSLMTGPRGLWAKRGFLYNRSSR